MARVSWPGPAPEFICLFVLALAGCTTVGQEPACLGGEGMMRTELYFGLKIGEQPIDPVTFDAFIEREVVGRFAEGFTVVPGLGTWRDPQGHIVREESRIIIRLHAQTPNEEEEINAIVAAYKRAFQQDAVLRVDTPSCVRF